VPDALIQTDPTASVQREATRSLFLRDFRGSSQLQHDDPGLVAVAGVACGQKDVRPGFNPLTVDQDVEIGEQSPVEGERQLSVLSEPATERTAHVSRS